MSDSTNSLEHVKGGAMHATGGPLQVTAVPDIPITDEEAEEAARELGMVLFSPRKSAALKRLGLHYSQHGVVPQGVGRLAVADDALQQLLERALELAKDPTTEPKVAVEAIAAGKGVADSIRDNVEYTVELQRDRLVDDPAAKKKARQDVHAQIQITVPPGSEVKATEVTP